MSDPQPALGLDAEKFKRITDDAVDQSRDLATRTAQQIDAGDYGADAWSRSMSQFFDIVARGSAAHFRTAIAGPCLGSGAADVPPSEEEIGLRARDWPRKVSIAKSFNDIARPSVVIPDYALDLTPTVVPAKATQFTLTVRLKDTQYIGRNYAAVLAFKQIGGTVGMEVVDYQVVMVAL